MAAGTELEVPQWGDSDLRLLSQVAHEHARYHVLFASHLQRSVTWLGPFEVPAHLQSHRPEADVSALGQSALDLAG